MVAGEGWPPLIIVAMFGALAFRYFGPVWAIPFGVLEIALYFLFRDPLRAVPPDPLAALAPVDGGVLEVSAYHDDVLPGEWIRVVIDTNRLGAYTVRAPIEGTVQSIAHYAGHDSDAAWHGGMWLRSEEQHDVVLMFPGRIKVLSPKTFVRYGERVGQGQRFAYLRLASRAEIYFPPGADVRVAGGDRVAAGETVLADLPG